MMVKQPKTSSDENPIKKITIQILKKIQLKNDMKFQRYLKEILIWKKTKKKAKKQNNNNYYLSDYYT